MLRVGKSINYLLTNSKVIADGKIFPVVADQGTTYPFITYRRTGCGDNDTKDNIYETQTTIELVIASTSYIEGLEIACKCAEVLERKRYQNIKDIKLVDASEEFVDEAFIQNLVFTIKLNK